MNVLADPKNPDVQDVLCIVYDILKTLPNNLNTVSPQAILQTCVIHLIRTTLRYASQKH